MKEVVICGSTGSIGQHTLNVINQHNDKFSVYGLVGHQNTSLMLSQCLAFKPKVAVLVCEKSANRLRALLLERGIHDISVMSSSQAIDDLVSDDQVDIVVAGIVGAAGLASTYTAIKSGKRVLLANKESLVMAGHLLLPQVSACSSELIPIDSEHNAIFQCLSETAQHQVVAGTPKQIFLEENLEKIFLCASGGPFFQQSKSLLAQVTPEQATNHPVWKMGKKISVDSATMMNKALELIEACWLFGVTPEQIEVVIHPQGKLHSMISYKDGSHIAQISESNMEIPIVQALSWPKRLACNHSAVDFFSHAMSFSVVNHELFKSIEISKIAFNEGPYACISINAANEVAVDCFLNKIIPFLEIQDIILKVLDKVSVYQYRDLASIEAINQLDQQVRVETMKLIKQSKHYATQSYSVFS